MHLWWGCNQPAQKTIETTHSWKWRPLRPADSIPNGHRRQTVKYTDIKLLSNRTTNIKYVRSATCQSHVSRKSVWTALSFKEAKQRHYAGSAVLVKVYMSHRSRLFTRRLVNWCFCQGRLSSCSTHQDTSSDRTELGVCALPHSIHSEMEMMSPLPATFNLISLHTASLACLYSILVFVN